MHCHEKWEYNDARHVQKLTGTVCLCERCHGVKHYGFSAVQGRGDEMRHHLAVVNGWDTRKTVAYLQACFGVWAQRCLHEWTVDMSWLEANK